MEIENISIEEYFRLGDTSEYDVFFDFIKPVNKFCGKSWNTNNMTFNEFKTIQVILSSPNYTDVKDLFVHLYRIKGSIKESEQKIFNRQSIFEFIKAKRFVEEFINQKLQRESELLSAKPDEKLLMIDAYNRLQPVSTLLTKIDLAERFGVSTEEVGNWKYNKVLNILYALKVRSDINNEYNDRLSRKP